MEIVQFEWMPRKLRSLHSLRFDNTEVIINVYTILTTTSVLRFSCENEKTHADKRSENGLLRT